MVTPTAPPLTADIASPAWWLSLRNTFASSEGHAYLLTGDLAGYVERTRPVRRFLDQALTGLVSRGATAGRIVATYDRARGIAFADDDTRARATALVMGSGATSTGDSGMSAILNQAGLGGQAGPPNPFDAVDPLGALRQLDTLLRAGAGEVAVVIDEAETICPPADIAMLGAADRTILVFLKVWGRDPAIIKSDNLIVLLAADVTGLHADIRSAASGWRAIDVPLPSVAQRQAFVEFYVATKAIPLASGVTAAALGRATAGLNLRHIEDILLAGTEAGGVTQALVKRRKDEVIRTEFSDVIEMLEPLPGGLSALGGMQHIKDWFTRRVLDRMRSGDLSRVPKGVLLVGPPGTGKTYLARALAGEAEMNCLTLQASKIQDSLVGASERALAKVFRFSVAMWPTVILVDELDQTDVGSRGTNSGNPVAKNLFNALLQFLGDESIRGKVLMLFASNRPDLLDDALLRFGRMDAIVPILLPEPADREAIAAKHVEAQGCRFTPAALERLNAGTNRYSAADVAALVAKSAERVLDRGGVDIESADIEAALRDLRPRTPRIADRFTYLAIDACNDLSLLPPGMADWFKAQEAQEAKGAVAPGARPPVDDDLGRRRRLE